MNYLQVTHTLHSIESLCSSSQMNLKRNKSKNRVLQTDQLQFSLFANRSITNSQDYTSNTTKYSTHQTQQSIHQEANFANINPKS